MRSLYFLMLPLCRRIVLLLLVFSANKAAASPVIELPKSALTPSELAVLYLDGDAKSEAIARYYQYQRGVPAENIVAVSFSADNTVIEPAHFIAEKQRIDRQLSAQVQALALAWAQPYRVGCMSVSAAFALGYSQDYCSQGCVKTRRSPYFHSPSFAPYRDFGIRPTMMLAANDLAQAFALINRGINADGRMPLGRVYLLETSDSKRSIRKVYYAAIQNRYQSLFDIQVLQQNSIRNKRDILFYFTGAKSIRYLDTLSFVPGAMADHLTSTGGQLTDSKQMSAMRWLEAGATGSYGTAIEPCNFLEKFPNPLVAMFHYTTGQSLLEAYWKSVQMPGQGNFIGEPLAAPFQAYRLRRYANEIRVHSPVLRPGRYRITADPLGFVLPAGSRYAQSLVQESIQTITPNNSSLRITPPYADRYHVERLP